MIISSRKKEVEVMEPIVVGVAVVAVVLVGGIIIYKKRK